MEFRDRNVSLLWEVFRTLLVIVGAFAGCFAFGVFSQRFDWFEASYLFLALGAFFLLVFIIKFRGLRLFEGSPSQDRFDLGPDSEDDEDGPGVLAPTDPKTPLVGSAAEPLPEDPPASR